VSEVYQDTVKFFINRDRNLDILTTLLSHRSETSKDDLPSWAPDWRVPTSEVPLLADWDSGFLFRKICAGGLGTKAPMQSYEELEVLRTEGYSVGVIEQAAEYTSTIDHILRVVPGYTFPGVPGGEYRKSSETLKVESFKPARHHTRCFYLHGGDICLGPVETRPGDNVVALLGGKPLFVVRRVDTAKGTPSGVNSPVGKPGPHCAYQLIGPCIVPELMFGGVIASAKKRNDALEYFVLI
jgi:hypothetical protein